MNLGLRIRNLRRNLEDSVSRCGPLWSLHRLTTRWRHGTIKHLGVNPMGLPIHSHPPGGLFALFQVLLAPNGLYFISSLLPSLTAPFLGSVPGQLTPASPASPGQTDPSYWLCPEEGRREKRGGERQGEKGEAGPGGSREAVAVRGNTWSHFVLDSLKLGSGSNL